MSDVIKIDLPTVNGVFEAGIAAIRYPTLPGEAQLRVDTTKNVDIAATNAAVYASNTAADVMGMQSAIGRKWLAVGAYAIVKAGLIRNVDNAPDGEWIFSVSVPDGNVPDRSMITADNIKKCLTAVVATKVDFWQTNHQTGQDAMQGFPKKVANIMWPGNDMTAKVKTKLMHTLGHWASTLYVLGKAKIPGIRETKPVAKGWPDLLRINEDAKMQFRSLPAGTASLEVAFQSLRMMLPHRLAILCPNMGSMFLMAQKRDDMMKDRAQYHMRAKYLTGRERIAVGPEGEACLGRLASFISQIYRSSTLYQSPKLSTGNAARRRSKAPDYDDYDPQWDALCKTYRQLMRRALTQAEGVLAALCKTYRQLMRRAPTQVEGALAQYVQASNQLMWAAVKEELHKPIYPEEKAARLITAAKARLESARALMGEQAGGGSPEDPDNHPDE